MLDRISIGVSDVTRSLALYDAALAKLGYQGRFAVDGAKKSGRKSGVAWIFSSLKALVLAH